MSLLTAVNQTKENGDAIRIIHLCAWLEKFEEGHELRRSIYHGEQASVDVVNAMDSVPEIVRELRGYEKDCIYIVEELGLQYRLSPDSTMASQQLRCMKKNKARIECLGCCNASGIDSIPLRMTGNARCPRAVFLDEAEKICVSTTEVIQNPG